MTSFSFPNWLTIHLLPPSTFALVIEVSGRHVRHNRGGRHRLNILGSTLRKDNKTTVWQPPLLITCNIEAQGLLNTFHSIIPKICEHNRMNVAYAGPVGV